jgi:PIN domain nuclease of toxin-antitoxin system
VSDYVTDTHALLWHLTNDSRLSATAQSIFTDADSGMHRIYIPTIVLVEVVYLAEKMRIDPSLVDTLMNLLATSTNYVEAALDANVVQSLRAISRGHVPDMPDRIIAATACYLGVPLISRDAAISAATGMNVIW